MWDALREICGREGRSVHEICTESDGQRSQSGLTAGVRVYILRYFREAATEEGHLRASRHRAGQGGRPESLFLLLRGPCRSPGRSPGRQIGRASCRESVLQYGWVASVADSLKKNII